MKKHYRGRTQQWIYHPRRECVPRKVFRIPSSVVNIVREVEKFLVFMGWDGQVPREKNLSVKN